MLFFLAYILLYIPLSLFYPVKVIGKKNLPKKNKGYVLVCNHSSLADPVMLDIKMHRKIRFLAKKELFKNKFFGWFLKRLGAIPVTREKPEISAIKTSLKVLKDGKTLGVFPEGTRNKEEDNHLQDLKSGAVTFASKGETFIVPMVYYRPMKACRRNYLLIGQPFDIIAEDKKRLTKEEVDLNTQRLSDEMEKLRTDFEAQLKEKQERKKHGKK